MFTLNIPVPCDWEEQLQYLLMQADNDTVKRVYICSPLRADTNAHMQWNMIAARYFMFSVSRNMNCIARAPHAYLPLLLDDNIPRERAIALQVGQNLLEQCHALYVCGNCISNGMHGEIQYAARLNILIVVFHEELFLPVRKIVALSGADENLVRFDTTSEHMSLNFSSDMLVKEDH